MCMIRDNDETCEKLLSRFQIRQTINFPIDELGELIDFNLENLMDDNDFVEITQRVDQLNYPYNLLPSSDEEEPVRGVISNAEDSTEDIHSTHDLLIEINQNANTPSASVNINFNISETNNTDESNEDRAFELNIPQILLSMSRISHQLNILSSASHD